MPLQLSQEQTQHLALTQSMCTSIRVLRMDCFELADYLQERAVENPMLEYEESPALLHAVTADRSEHRVASGTGSSGEDLLLNARGPERDFRHELASQLDFSSLEADIRRTAHYLVYHLDARGYLPVPLEEIEHDLRCGMACACAALQAVQALDPPGIGARDLRECLLLQLPQEEKFATARALLEQNLLPELAQKRYAAIATALHVSRAQAERACDIIRTLSPIPRNGAPDNDPVHLAIPEVEVVWTGACYEATLIDEMLPMLRLAPPPPPGSLDAPAQRYVAQHTANAQELLAWVAHRKETLLRCARQLVAQQQEFFAQGTASALCPLQMPHLAAALGVHLSTISRTLNGKYLQCRWGVFALNWFFQQAAEGPQGSCMSATAVRSRIAELIAAEDKRHPLSDQALSNALAHSGIELARRTVAKYRDAQGILPAQARREP